MLQTTSQKKKKGFKRPELIPTYNASLWLKENRTWNWNIGLMAYNLIAAKKNVRSD